MRSVIRGTFSAGTLTWHVQRKSTHKRRRLLLLLIETTKERSYCNHRGLISDFRQIKQRVVQRTGYVRRWVEGSAICQNIISYGNVCSTDVSQEKKHETILTWLYGKPATIETLWLFKRKPQLQPQSLSTA